MLQRTKYNRFKNESVTPVDDLLHNLSTNSKASAVAGNPATIPCLVPTTDLQKDQEDGPTSLCTFIHKVSHMKLSSTGSLLGIKNLSSAVKELAGSKLQGSSPALSTAAGASDNTCNLVSTPPCSQQDMSKMSTGKKTRSEEMHLGGEDWNQSSSFVNKPSRGWLHSNEKIQGPGVTYIVKYLGCIEVLRSMRSLDFNTRTQITRNFVSYRGEIKSKRLMGKGLGNSTAPSIGCNDPQFHMAPRRAFQCEKDLSQTNKVRLQGEIEAGECLQIYGRILKK